MLKDRFLKSWEEKPASVFCQVFQSFVTNISLFLDLLLSLWNSESGGRGKKADGLYNQFSNDENNQI